MIYKVNSKKKEIFTLKSAVLPGMNLGRAALPFEMSSKINQYMYTNNNQIDNHVHKHFLKFLFALQCIAHYVSIKLQNNLTVGNCTIFIHQITGLR